MHPAVRAFVFQKQQEEIQREHELREQIAVEPEDIIVLTKVNKMPSKCFFLLYTTFDYFIYNKRLFQLMVEPVHKLLKMRPADTLLL